VPLESFNIGIIGGNMNIAEKIVEESPGTGDETDLGQYRA